MQQFFFVSFSDSENRKCVNEFKNLSETMGFLNIVESNDAIMHLFGDRGGVPDDVAVFRNSSNYRDCRFKKTAWFVMVDRGTHWYPLYECESTEEAEDVRDGMPCLYDEIARKIVPGEATSYHDEPFFR